MVGSGEITKTKMAILYGITNKRIKEEKTCLEKKSCVEMGTYCKFIYIYLYLNVGKYTALHIRISQFCTLLNGRRHQNIRIKPI